jgi:hypothetical protein
MIDDNMSLGLLVEMEPRPLYQRTVRKLYLAKQLANDVFGQTTNITLIKRFAELEAYLADFVISPTIDPRYIKGLLPRNCGVWEIKSFELPAIRVFCLFADRNVLIATHYEFRKNLGKANSLHWKTEIRRAQHTWQLLFPGIPYLNTDDPDKLFSGALNESYFKR